MIEWYYLALISGILASFTSLIEKHMLKKEHATSFTAITTLLMAVLVLFFIPSADFNINTVQLVLTFITGLFFVASSLLVARLYRHMEVSTTAPITSTLPILFIIVLAFLFLNEALSIVQYAAIIVLVIAIYFMLGDAKKGIPVEFLRKNIQYFVLAGLLYAIGATILKFGLGTTNPYTFLILSTVSMALWILVFVFARFKTFKYVLRDIKSYKVEVFVFALASVGYAVFYYVALTQAPISLVFPIRSATSIIVAVFASGAFFKEKIAKRIPLAILMIVAMYFLIA